LSGFFLRFRDGIIESYSELFTRNDNEKESNFGAEEDFRLRYGWYNSLYKLANGDVTKIEEVSKINLHYCLTMLQYKIELDNAEAKNLKNKFKKNGR
tara:strand:+ start:12 stop:302 length:291 start_codon:yes stop_codon:yes gene_type:complete